MPTHVVPGFSSLHKAPFKFIQESWPLWCMNFRIRKAAPCRRRRFLVMRLHKRRSTSISSSASVSTSTRFLQAKKSNGLWPLSLIPSYPKTLKRLRCRTPFSKLAARHRQHQRPAVQSWFLQCPRNPNCDIAIDTVPNQTKRFFFAHSEIGVVVFRGFTCERGVRKRRGAIKSASYHRDGFVGGSAVCWRIDCTGNLGRCGLMSRLDNRIEPYGSFCPFE